MGFESKSRSELEVYGTAVGVALSNGLQDEAMDMAFKRGGGITVRENRSRKAFTIETDLDANAVGGAEARLSFNYDEAGLNNIGLSANDKKGGVNLQRDEHGEIGSVSVDKEDDSKFETKVDFKRDANGVTEIGIDRDNDGKVDAILTPVAGTDSVTKGFNVDIGADGTNDGFAEFMRNDKNQVVAIRFRQVESK